MSRDSSFEDQLAFYERYCAQNYFHSLRNGSLRELYDEMHVRINANSHRESMILNGYIYIALFSLHDFEQHNPGKETLLIQNTAIQQNPRDNL